MRLRHGAMTAEFCRKTHSAFSISLVKFIEMTGGFIVKAGGFTIKPSGLIEMAPAFVE
jgi:hypothetical protein